MFSKWNLLALVFLVPLFCLSQDKPPKSILPQGKWHGQAGCTGKSRTQLEFSGETLTYLFENYDNDKCDNLLLTTKLVGTAKLAGSALTLTIKQITMTFESEDALSGPVVALGFELKKPKDITGQVLGEGDEALHVPGIGYGMKGKLLRTADTLTFGLEPLATTVNIAALETAVYVEDQAAPAPESEME